LISNNRAWGGGAVFCDDKSSPVLTRCTFTGNSTYFGGGIYCSDGSEPVLIDCTITGNDSWSGGGVYCFDASPTLIGCAITNNTAAASGYNARGGAVYLYRDSFPVLTNCAITGNTADDGGGVYCDRETNPTLINCTIAGNTAVNNGAALACDSYHSSNPSDVAMTNCILWNGLDQVWNNDGSTLAITYCDVQGGWIGTGNIDADPMFADSNKGDYHITGSSPCRDMGDDSVVIELHDFEGDPRIVRGVVDIGADEYYYHLYHVGDVVSGSPIEVKVIGYPYAPVTLYLGSGIQDPPQSTPHGDFWLTWPLLWQGNIGTIPGDGVLVLPAMVPSGWSAGSEHPLQALVGQWGGISTKLTNLMTLTVGQ